MQMPLFSEVARVANLCHCSILVLSSLGDFGNSQNLNSSRTLPALSLQSTSGFQTLVRWAYFFKMIISSLCSAVHCLIVDNLLTIWTKVITLFFSKVYFITMKHRDVHLWLLKYILQNQHLILRLESLGSEHGPVSCCTSSKNHKASSEPFALINRNLPMFSPPCCLQFGGCSYPCGVNEPFQTLSFATAVAMKTWLFSKS